MLRDLHAEERLDQFLSPVKVQRPGPRLLGQRAVPVLKQFGKRCPDEVKSIEDIAAAHVAKRAARKAEKARSEE